MTVAPGQIIAGYEILRAIGRGGMGEIWLARQKSIGREVALKILSPKLVERDPRFAERFIAEAQAAGRLNHPNIIAVHDVGQTELDGTTVHYFSMEYIDGSNFRDLVDEGGPISEQLVGTVMQAMTDALTYAHGLGMIHRDIKPENIMQTRDGRVKLADFGLAMQVDADGEQEVERDAEGRAKVMGTPLYMSPEQARGVVLDFRSDQYSLGATLFTLLTAQFPYRRANAREVMRAHVRDPVPDPRELVECNESWRRLAMKLMAKLPEHRFSTPQDLHDAVLGCIAGTWPPRRRTRSSEHPPVAGGSRLGLIIGGVTAVAVLAAGGAWLLSAGDDGKPAGPQDQRTVVADDAPLARAERLLAQLPADPEAALATLRGSEGLGDVRLAQDGPAAELLRRKEQLLTEQVRVLAAKRAAELETQCAAVAVALAAGRLGEARAGLAGLGGERAQALAAQVAAAEAALGEELRQALTQAVAVEALEQALQRGRDAGLDPLAMAKLVEAADGARKRIAADQLAARAVQTQQDQASWGRLAAALQKLRSAAPSARRQGELAQVRLAAGTCAAELHASERQEQALRLAELITLAHQTGEDLTALLRSAPQTVQVVRAGKPPETMQAVGLGGAGLELRQAAGVGSSSLSLALSDPSLEVEPLLIAAVKKAGRDDPPRRLALFAWCWSQPRGVARLAALGREDGDARLLAGLDPELAEALLRVLHRHEYARAEGQPPFSAAAATMLADGVLRWQPQQRQAHSAVEFKTGKHPITRDLIQGLRWELGPMRDGILRLEVAKLAQLSLFVGMQRGAQSAHLVVNHHRGRQELGLWSAGSDGRLHERGYLPLRGGLSSPFLIELVLVEDGSLACRCAGGEFAADTLPPALAGPDPLVVRLDALVFAPPKGQEPSAGVLELSAVEFAGRLPLAP